MTELPTILAGVSGVLAPILIGTLRSWLKSPGLRWLAAMIISAVLGIAGAIMAEGVPDLPNIATWATVAWGMSQATWNTWRVLAEPTE